MKVFIDFRCSQKCQGNVTRDDLGRLSCTGLRWRRTKEPLLFWLGLGNRVLLCSLCSVVLWTLIISDPVYETPPDDLQRRFFRATILRQGCYISKQNFNSVATLCCAEIVVAKFPGVTSPRELNEKSCTSYHQFFVRRRKASWPEGKKSTPTGYIRYFRKRVEMCPAIVCGMVTGEAPVSFPLFFFSVPSNSPRSLREV